MASVGTAVSNIILVAVAIGMSCAAHNPTLDTHSARCVIDLSVSSAVWNHSAAVTGAFASAIVKSATGFLTPDSSYSFCAFLNSDPNGLAA